MESMAANPLQFRPCFGFHCLQLVLFFELIFQRRLSYRREVWCSPAGDEISDPGLNCTLVSLHYLSIA